MGKINLDKVKCLFGKFCQTNSEHTAKKWKFVPDNLTEERDSQSDEAKEMGATLINPGIFDRIELVVPKYPLFDVEALPSEDEPDGSAFYIAATITRIFHLPIPLFMWVMYPFAVALKELLRFYGYIIYYFWAVPVRYFANVILAPLLDGLYRLLYPFFIFIHILSKPFIAIMTDFWGACGSCIIKASGK